MATAHDPSATRAVPRRFRWTKEQYFRLAELGFFRNKHVELIHGEIWRVTVNPPHAMAVELLDKVVRHALGDDVFRFRVVMPLDLGRRNQPAPDMVVLLGDIRDSQSHPTAALLVIELSDSSLRDDRTVMARLYAKAGIPEYWILNLVDRQLEVHRNPGPDPDRRGRFKYHDVAIVPATGHVEPLAKTAARIAVADLLP
jgi:Uma2 family endonuclease